MKLTGRALQICARRLLTFFFSLLLSLTGAPGRAADALTNPSDASVDRFRASLDIHEIAWLARHPELRVGDGPDFRPFHAWQGDQYSGPSADYLELLSRRTDLQFRTRRFADFPAVLAALDRGNIDLIPMLTPTEARRKKYLFTGGHLHSPAVVITRSGSIELPASLDGLRIAVEKGHASHEVLERSKPAARLIDFVDTEAALRAVSTGEADAYIGMLAVAHYYIEQLHLINLTVRKHFDADLSAMAIAVNQNQPVLHSILRKAMMFVSDDEGNALIRRNLPAIVGIPGEHFRLTATEQAWLLSHGPIRMGYDQTFYPLSYTNPNHQAEGYSIELFRLLRDKTGLTVDETAGPWSSVLKKALGGDLDVLVAAARTPQRHEQLLFVGPYLSAPTVIVTRSNYQQVWNLAEFNGRKLALLKEHFLHDRIRKAYPTIQLVEVATQEDALSLVAAGSADVAIGNLHAVNRLIQSRFLGSLYIAGHVPDGDSELYLGVSKKSPELAAILRRALDALTPEEIVAAKNRWLDTVYAPAKPEPDIATLAGPPAAALLTLLIGGAWSARLLRRERQARRTAEASLAERAQRLMAANARMETLAGTAARRLRRSAASLHDNLNLLRDTASSDGRDDVPAALERLYESDGQIGHVLADLERLSSGAQVSLPQETVDISALVQALWPKLTESHATVQAVQLDCAPDIRMQGDPVLLRGVLFSLLSRAIAHVRPQAAAWVKVRASATGRGFEVCDNGPGLSLAEANALSGAVAQTDSRGKGSLEPDGGDTDLSIAMWLTHRYGGEISIVPQDSGGTCFRITLGGAPA